VEEGEISKIDNKYIIEGTQDAISTSNPFLNLAIKLNHEYSQSSIKAMVLQYLPYFWKPTTIRDLQGTFLEKFINLKKEDLKKLHNLVKDKISLEDFVEVYSIAESKSFDISNGRKVFIKDFSDKVSRSLSGNVKIRTDNNGDLYIEAIKTIQENEEVSIQIEEELPNLILLTKYGIFDELNALKLSVIAFPSFNESSSLFHRKVQLFHKIPNYSQLLNVNLEDNEVIIDSLSQNISQKLLAYGRLETLDLGFQEFIEDEKILNEMVLCNHELKATQFLYRKLSSMKENFTTSWIADLELLAKEPDMETERKLAILMRMEHKKLVEGTITHLMNYRGNIFQTCGLIQGSFEYLFFIITIFLVLLIFCLKVVVGPPPPPPPLPSERPKIKKN